MCVFVVKCMSSSIANNGALFVCDKLIRGLLNNGHQQANKRLGHNVANSGTGVRQRLTGYKKRPSP